MPVLLANNGLVTACQEFGLLGHEKLALGRRGTNSSRSLRTASEVNRNDLSDMRFGTNLRQPGVRLPTRGHERNEVDEACARARVLMSKPEREQSSIVEVNSSRATNRSRALTRHHLSPPPLRAIPVLRNEPLHIRSSQNPLSQIGRAHV